MKSFLKTWNLKLKGELKMNCRFFYVCGKIIQVFDLKNNEKVLCMLGTLNTI